jgi:hypothetical protein
LHRDQLKLRSEKYETSLDRHCSSTRHSPVRLVHCQPGGVLGAKRELRGFDLLQRHSTCFSDSSDVEADAAELADSLAVEHRSSYSYLMYRMWACGWKER